MKLLLSPAAALLALSLAACQAKAPPAEAQAATPPDAVVAAAVRDVRAAAIDPVTGAPRDASAAFIAPTATLAAPRATLGELAPGAPSPTLDIGPGAIVPADAQAGN